MSDNIIWEWRFWNRSTELPETDTHNNDNNELQEQIWQTVSSLIETNQIDEFSYVLADYINNLISRWTRSLDTTTWEYDPILNEVMWDMLATAHEVENALRSINQDIPFWLDDKQILDFIGVHLEDYQDILHEKLGIAPQENILWSVVPLRNQELDPIPPVNEWNDRFDEIIEEVFSEAIDIFLKKYPGSNEDLLRMKVDYSWHNMNIRAWIMSNIIYELQWVGIEINDEYTEKKILDKAKEYQADILQEFKEIYLSQKQK